MIIVPDPDKSAFYKKQFLWQAWSKMILPFYYHLLQICLFYILDMRQYEALLCYFIPNTTLTKAAQLNGDGIIPIYTHCEKAPPFVLNLNSLETTATTLPILVFSNCLCKKGSNGQTTEKHN